jgi:hypothetical protein
MTTILSLPLDVLRLILSTVDLCIQLYCREVCKRFANAIPPCSTNPDLEWKPNRVPTSQELARKGYLSSLQRLHRQGRLDMQCPLICSASIGGHPHVIQWLSDNGCEWNDDVTVVAVEYGHLDVLKMIHAKGVTFDSVTIYHVFRHGYIHILEWLFSLNLITHKYFNLNSSTDDVRLMKWAHEHNLINSDSWTATACSMAAYHGNLESLQWLRSFNCPWNRNVTNAACFRGALDVVKWAYANGCDLIVDDCLIASQKHPEVHNWLEANF